MAKSLAAEIPGSVQRKCPEVEPNNVRLNHDGFGWRSFKIILPKDAIFDDLKEPSIWKRVQANYSTALRPFDDLRIIAYDQTWFADVTVGDADTWQVVLCKPRLTQLPDRHDKKYADETYRVVNVGAGYRVQRIKDGHYMTGVVQTSGQAERDLFNLYPRRV